MKNLVCYVERRYVIIFVIFKTGDLICRHFFGYLRKYLDKPFKFLQKFEFLLSLFKTHSDVIIIYSNFIICKTLKCSFEKIAEFSELFIENDTVLMSLFKILIL